MRFFLNQSGAVDPIRASKADRSDCREQPVFSRTRRSWLRTVLIATSPLAASISGVLPRAIPLATRASAGVRSKSDFINVADGTRSDATGISSSKA